ncbi:MAG: zinc ribbon domain-containing protein [Pseudomonadota bacterium]
MTHTTGKKRYATQKQKSLLKLAGNEPCKGMTFEEAKKTINALIKEGKLSESDIENIWRFEPPTKKQLKFLQILGVRIDDDLTRGKAAYLIDNIQEEKMRNKPMTDRQREFIIELGGTPEHGMSRYSARQFIEYLLDQQEICPNCETSIPPTVSRCPYCGGFLPEPIETLWWPSAYEDAPVLEVDKTEGFFHKVKSKLKNIFF